MAQHTYGSGSLPVTLKTTTVVQKGLQTKTVEKVHNSGAEPAQSIGAIVSGLKVINYTNEPYGGGFIKQTVVYEGAESEELPATTYESQGGAIELDIRQHPDWETTFKADWDENKGEFKPTSAYYGITSYLVGTVSVTKTEYFSSQPDDDYALIGTLAVPGGGYSGAGKWLIIGTSRSKQGEGLYTKQTTYQYSAKEWNADIYS